MRVRDYEIKPNANLTGANLTGANLRDADLIGADLRDANLRDADLVGANLRDVNLTGANLAGANLAGANLRDADLIGADLRFADLEDADLRDADLRGADLRGANLRGADLEGANLTNAYLRGADLTNANLVGTVLIVGKRRVEAIKDKQLRDELYDARQAAKGENALRLEAEAEVERLQDAVRQLLESYEVEIASAPPEHHSMDCCRFEHGIEQDCDCAIGVFARAVSSGGEG